MRITGTYSVEGEMVEIRAFLRKGGTTVAALPEIRAGKAKAIDELMKAILSELAKIQAG